MKKLSNKKIYQLTLNELNLPRHKDNGLCWAIKQTLIKHGYDSIEAENIGYRVDNNENDKYVILNNENDEDVTLQEFDCFFEIKEANFQWTDTGYDTSKRWFIRELILMFCIEMCE